MSAIIYVYTVLKRHQYRIARFDIYVMKKSFVSRQMQPKIIFALTVTFLVSRFKSENTVCLLDFSFGSR